MGRSGPGARWVLKPRPITVVMDLGMLGAAIYRAISKGPAAFSHSPEQGGGCRFQSNLLETALIRADQQQVAHSNALPLWYLSCSCLGCPRRRAVTQRQIDLAAGPQPMQ